MSKVRILIAFGLALGFSVFSSLAASGQEGSSVVAEVGGHKITAEELQQKKAGKLLQAQYKYYLTEREALDQLIDEEILEMQAKREGISVDDLLKRHVAVDVKEATEDQLRFFYEGLGSDEPFEAVHDKIADTIHQIRFGKARETYLTSLRGQYGVVVELNQPSAHVDVTNAARRGPQNAPVQLIEFADYECPYCQKVHIALAKIQAEFGDKVALVFKDFPLPMHALAEKAAEATRCAGAQGKFWEFHDALFMNKKLQVPDLKQQARDLQLDAARFDQCLDSGETAAAVRKDGLEGQRLGLTGTPSFFANGHFLSGAVSLPKLRETVQQELAAASTQKSSVAASTLRDPAGK